MRIGPVLLLTVLLLPAMLLVTPPGRAAEAETKPRQDSPEQSTETREAEPPADNNNPNGNRGRKQGDIFIPSEEISEDFAVSFPVDI